MTDALQNFNDALQQTFRELIPQNPFQGPLSAIPWGIHRGTA